MNLILGIDPGRDKTGFAFADFDKNLIASGIFASLELDEFLKILSGNKDFSRWLLEGELNLLKDSQIKIIALGDGTHSKKFREYLQEKISDSIKILTVNEKNTTLEARKIYWNLHKPGVLIRLIPESLRVPARNLDDLAAYLIALRALQN